MKQRWLVLFLLLSVAVALLAGCTTRATTAPQTSAPAGPPAPTAPAVQPTVPGPGTAAPVVTEGPTQPPPTPPAALSSPQLTAKGTLESGIQWGTTSDGNYYKGDPKAPLIMFEFSDFQ
jgi:hypothetical protein